MSHNYPCTGHVTLKFCQDVSNKIYAHAKNIKTAAFENFKLFPENQPPNKIGLNND